MMYTNIHLTKMSTVHSGCSSRGYQVPVRATPCTSGEKASTVRWEGQTPNSVSLPGHPVLCSWILDGHWHGPDTQQCRCCKTVEINTDPHWSKYGSWTNTRILHLTRHTARVYTVLSAHVTLLSRIC